MRVLLERANVLSKQYGNSPVIISGDLNSTPKVVYVAQQLCFESSFYGKRSFSLLITSMIILLGTKRFFPMTQSAICKFLTSTEVVVRCSFIL